MKNLESERGITMVCKGFGKENPLGLKLGEPRVYREFLGGLIGMSQFAGAITRTRPARQPPARCCSAAPAPSRLGRAASWTRPARGWSGSATNSSSRTE
jgi:hypothetical protein